MKRPLCGFFVLFLLMELIVTMVAIRNFPDYSYLEKEWITVQGTVSEKEVATLYGEEILQITLENVAINPYTNQVYEEEIPIKQILCNIDTSQSEDIQNILKIGSQVVVEGQVSNFSQATNPGQFDFKQYYQRQGYGFSLSYASILWAGEEYNKIKEFLYNCRQNIAMILELYLSEENSGVIKAMMIGDKSSLEDSLQNLYQNSGIAHILAISGLHISLLGMGVFKCLGRTGINYKCGAIVSIILLWNYGVMVGMGTSTFRAIIMFSIMVIGKVILRSYDLLTAMAIAAFILLIQNPFLLYDVGFQLSFMAILGVAMVIPSLISLTEVKNKIGMGVISSLGITLSTLPIILYNYYEVPLYSVFLNLLVIPLMSILLLSGILLCLAYYIFSPICNVFVYPINGILFLYKKVCELFAMIPYNRVTIGKPQLWQIFLYYAILVIIMISIAYMPKKIGAYWIVMGLYFLTSRFDNEFSITFLDVGQGDGIVIETESGKVCMIDGGSVSTTSVGEYRIIPYLKSQGISEITCIFLTHMHEDHIGGIVELMEQSVEENLKVQTIVLPELEEWDDTYIETIAIAQEAGIGVKTMKAGEVFLLDQVEFICLHPYAEETISDVNNTSLVLSVEYDSFHGIFTGDLEKDGEAFLLENMDTLDNIEEFDWLEFEGYDLLKVGHHGSNTSSTIPFLEWCQPQFAVISCGENNSYGHPHKETIGSLEEKQIAYAITKDTGALTVTIANSGEIQVKQFLKKTE